MSQPVPTPPPHDDSEDAGERLRREAARLEEQVSGAQARLERATRTSEPPPLPETLRAGASRPASQRPSGKGSSAGGMSQAYALAMELLVYLGVATGAGWAIDRWVVGSGQTWTIAGALFGLLGGGYRTIRGAMRMFADEPPKSSKGPG